MNILNRPLLRSWSRERPVARVLFIALLLFASLPRGAQAGPSKLSVRANTSGAGPARGKPPVGRVWLHVQAGSEESLTRSFIPSGSAIQSRDVLTIELESERQGYVYLAQRAESGVPTLLNSAPLLLEPDQILRQRLRADNAHAGTSLYVLVTPRVLSADELTVQLAQSADKRPDSQEKDKQASRVPPTQRTPPRPVDEKDRSDPAQRGQYAISDVPGKDGIVLLRFAVSHAPQVEPGPLPASPKATSPR